MRTLLHCKCSDPQALPYNPHRLQHAPAHCTHAYMLLSCVLILLLVQVPLRPLVMLLLPFMLLLLRRWVVMS